MSKDVIGVLIGLGLNVVIGAVAWLFTQWAHKGDDVR